VEHVTRNLRLAHGPEIRPDGIGLRVWAPLARSLDVVLFDDGIADLAAGPSVPSQVVAMTHEDEWWSAELDREAINRAYALRLDGDRLLADPASHFQPWGPFGSSQFVDPSVYSWGDDGWSGVEAHRHVIAEIHIGTFTPEGTFAAAAERLSELVDVGFTTVEVMPIADFAGEFGWGYDGVCLYAPTRNYGTPDDFRAFVDRAHSLGLAVLLDVVYNHFGPSGSVLSALSSWWFTDRHANEWGESLDFDGPHSSAVRSFFVDNAHYWIADFHLDGLRLDASHVMVDDSSPHVLAEISATARAAGAGRSILVVMENDAQQAYHLRAPEDGGSGLDAAWNDDFHHAAMVAATGRREAYYSDFAGTPQELVSASTRGYLYQGQRSDWLESPRGHSALDLGPRRFVHCLENHDQIGNTLTGRRMQQQTSPGRWRALTAVLLLSPALPLLFQGQDFGASNGFVFFAAHDGELADAVRQGRWRELQRFPSPAGEGPERMHDPSSPDTLAGCRLDWSERDRHPEMLQLHRDLLTWRSTDAVFSAPSPVARGAVLGAESFVLRFELPSPSGADVQARLLLVNLGADRPLWPMAEPLTAPTSGASWTLAWSSESIVYGGRGTGSLDGPDAVLPGHSALLLA
jgi:maltooligosyltrehalose trehalohydrolase